ncbi:MAG: hypothetical protein WB542_10425 [Polaromonas sp.]
MAAEQIAAQACPVRFNENAVFLWPGERDLIIEKWACWYSDAEG